MIIALMQKETRQRRIRGLEGEDYVQFRVFKVSRNLFLSRVLVRREFPLDDEYRESIEIYRSQKT